MAGLGGQLPVCVFADSYNDNPTYDMDRGLHVELRVMS